MGQYRMDSLDQLDRVGLKEFLDHDPRPTFILDLDPDDLNTKPGFDKLDLLFCNEALTSYHVLLDLITGDTDDTSDSNTEQERSIAFRKWATSITTFDDSRDVYPFTHVYHNMLWTGSTIRKRWRLISGNQCHQIPESLFQQDVVAIGGQTSRSASRKDSDGVSFHSKNQSNHQIPHTLSHSAQARLANDNNKDFTNVSSNLARQDEVVHRRVGFSSRSSTNTGQTSETSFSLTLTTPENATSDWTIRKPRGILSDHLVFARSIDWASTSLGAMKTWSKELRQAANLVMGNPHPAALFWGHDLTMLYNEAYKNEVAGNKHPTLMGTGAEGPFRETWDAIGPIFIECARTGRSERRDNSPIALERHGYLEECYFSFSITPLYGGGSKVLGFYNAPFETTRDCINHRRMLTVQRLGGTIAGAKSVKHFWKQILLGLEENEYDIPFALLYSITDSEDGDEASISSGSTLSLKACILEGSLGVPVGHPAAPTRLDLKRSREGFIPSFREAMRTREPTRLQVRDGSLPEYLLEGVQWRGFGEPCNDAVIFPVRPTNGDTVQAFLLLGINPRRAYDAEYQAFTRLLNRQLATSLASVMLFEEELKRNQNAIIAAALEQEQLNEQLTVQTNRLQRMTALSPLGMFYINAEGLILEANDRYYEMTRQDRNNLTEMGWMDQLVESSKKTMEDGWHKLTVDLVPWSAELQLKSKRLDPSNPNAEPIDYWVLACSQPELGVDGKLRSVMGSITDVSHLKWAQGLQERRLREADERRRQQNEFIDITSHEMRNPLSAIVQCADDIVSTMTDYQTRNTQHDETRSIISSCIESATTIALCVQHQKSIVDDILTVSKLDSNLLELAPTACQPITVARGVMKMFESELLAKKIKFSFIVNPDYEKNGVDWVSMDPSRMSQVLINLMTNAIKFTSDRAVREIKMCIAASLETPYQTNIQQFDYIPRRNTLASAALNKDWNTGESVYIRLKVIDTGCGLTQDEKQLLFQRFQQASPRTHAQYGGSGLGLFISRQLTELHGGQIGVASKAEEGSTFGFYIRTRRIAPPEKKKPLLSSTSSAPQLKSNETYSPSKLKAIASHIESELHKTANISEVPASPDLRRVEPISPTTLSILVVEDNLVNQKVLMRQLQKTGATVFVADNGQKALDFLETTEFRIADGSGQKLSIVLMDLEMPVMDGLTCVRNIRQMEKEGAIARHVPVIAVTANVRMEQVLAARAAGMDDVVSKPFRIPELFAKINTLLTTGSGESTPTTTPSALEITPAAVM